MPGDVFAGAEFLDAQAVAGPDVLQEVVDEVVDGQGLFRGPVVGDLRARYGCAPVGWLGLVDGGFGTLGACGARLEALLAAFFGLLEAVGLALEGDDLGVADEAVDQGDHAGGVGEDLAPLGRWGGWW